ncbi:hypothetical protein [Rhodococcus sp. (in: high G+C Gram-positive bacteria)]|uniref:hypothetical protein n=1 Tax=Rhodococcus sp. TaxID=1831 RepID=UPI003B8A68AA
MNHDTSVSTPARPRPRTVSRHERQWLKANCDARLEAHGVNPRRAWTVARVYRYYEQLAVLFPDNTDAGDPMVNPSVDRIAEEIESTPRGVKKALARLEALGLLRTVKHTGRAAWRAVTNSLSRLLPSRGEHKTPREVNTTPVPAQPLYMSSSFDQKSDQRGRSAGADRRVWASAAPTTPMPPRYVREERTESVASEALRSKLRTGWRGLAKR